MELFYFANLEADQKSLTDFIKRNSSGGGAEFLQSYEWGNFLSEGGEEIIRVGVREKENILLVATLVKKIIFKNYFYLYAPRGPIFSKEIVNEPEIIRVGIFYSPVFKFFSEQLKKTNPQALFLRFEPLPVKAEFKNSETDDKNFLSSINQPADFIFKKTINLQPAKTLLLDLKSSEAELLKAMHQKTRYNIRLAQKRGIVIREADLDKDAGANDLKEFWRLLKTTGQRDNFRLHSFSHYEKLLAVNRTAPGFIKLFLAQFEGKNIAAGIFSYYGDKVTYLHGASDNKFRNLMAPYLLQFSLIKYAQAENYLYYDFYGIDEKKWPGVTRFKVGFGGRVFEYAGTYDLVFKPGFYRFYELIRKIRRLI